MNRIRFDPLWNAHPQVVVLFLCHIINDALWFLHVKALALCLHDGVESLLLLTHRRVLECFGCMKAHSNTTNIQLCWDKMSHSVEKTYLCLFSTTSMSVIWSVCPWDWLAYQNRNVSSLGLTVLKHLKNIGTVQLQWFYAVRRCVSSCISSSNGLSYCMSGVCG